MLFLFSFEFWFVFMTIYEIAYIIFKCKYFFHEVFGEEDTSDMAKEMKERYSAIFNAPLVIGGIVYMFFKIATVY